MRTPEPKRDWIKDRIGHPFCPVLLHLLLRQAMCFQKGLPTGFGLAMVLRTFRNHGAQLLEALLYFLRRRGRGGLGRLHLLQDERTIDQALQGTLRGVARGIDTEWLQDAVTNLFLHIALQDHAAIDDRDHVIEHHSSRWQRCGALLSPCAGSDHAASKQNQTPNFIPAANRG